MQQERLLLLVEMHESTELYGSIGGGRLQDEALCVQRGQIRRQVHERRRAAAVGRRVWIRELRHRHDRGLPLLRISTEHMLRGHSILARTTLPPKVGSRTRRLA